MTQQYLAQIISIMTLLSSFLGFKNYDSMFTVENQKILTSERNKYTSPEEPSVNSFQNLFYI